jgi:hypothetical protein
VGFGGGKRLRLLSARAEERLLALAELDEKGGALVDQLTNLSPGALGRQERIDHLSQRLSRRR